jgi:aminopeptidase N
MYDDGYDYSQNVAQTDILTPAEINRLFNSFTYDKGSSILFMLESTVGYDNFRDGLRV